MARLKRLVMAQLPHLVQQRVVAGGAGLTDPVDQQAYLYLNDVYDEQQPILLLPCLLLTITKNA